MRVEEAKGIAKEIERNLRYEREEGMGWDGMGERVQVENLTKIWGANWRSNVR